MADGNDHVTIGEFARRAHLIAKALRVYDDAGLLRPVDVDPTTGYRRYARTQLHRARLIALLRGTDMSLADHLRRYTIEGALAPTAAPTPTG